MRQFYEAYPDWGIVSALLRQSARKPHENPAIGVLLCANKDDEVVEYALSRTTSPALIAEYQMQLSDKTFVRT